MAATERRLTGSGLTLVTQALPTPPANTTMRISHRKLTALIALTALAACNTGATTGDSSSATNGNGAATGGSATRPVVSSISVEKDVPFLEAGRSQSLDLYLPMPAQSRRGAVVWIHGGGWAGGKKDDNREVMVSRSLAAEGYLVASIDYQLATDAAPSWPQVLFDCKNAVRYLRANAQKYGIDPDKIAVAGGSAGGHLALMVAYTRAGTALSRKRPTPASAVRSPPSSICMALQTCSHCKRSTKTARRPDG